MGGASPVIESVKTKSFNQLRSDSFSSFSIHAQRRPTLSALCWPYFHFGLGRAGKGAVLPGATSPLRPPSPSSTALSIPKASFSRQASGRPHHLRRPFASICIFPISSHLLPSNGKPRHMMMVLNCNDLSRSSCLLFSYSISLVAPFTSPPPDLFHFSSPLLPRTISQTQKRKTGQVN